MGNQGRVTGTSGCLYSMLVLSMFTLGGTTGIVLGNAAMDVSLHDTYYVIAHFHFILSLGAIVSLLVGVLHSQGMVIAGLPSHASLVCTVYFTLKAHGILVTFTPMHLLGYNYQPRRVHEYPDNYNCWSSLSSLASGVTLLSMSLLPPPPPNPPLPLYPG